MSRWEDQDWVELALATQHRQQAATEYWFAACLVFVWGWHMAWSCLCLLFFSSTVAVLNLVQAYAFCIKRKWRAESCSFFLPSHNFSLLAITLPSQFLSYSNCLGKWKANQNMLINLTYEDGVKISELKNMEAIIFPRKEFSFCLFKTKLIVSVSC